MRKTVYKKSGVYSLLNFVEVKVYLKLVGYAILCWDKTISEIPWAHYSLWEEEYKYGCTKNP